MFGYDGAAVGGMAILWLLWLSISILALVSFFRGMRALVQIAQRLEGIERVLATRSGSHDARAS